jgi:hypothetical protein
MNAMYEPNAAPAFENPQYDALGPIPPSNAAADYRVSEMTDNVGVVGQRMFQESNAGLKRGDSVC